MTFNCLFRSRLLRCPLTNDRQTKLFSSLTSSLSSGLNLILHHSDRSCLEDSLVRRRKTPEVDSRTKVLATPIIQPGAIYNGALLCIHHQASLLYFVCFSSSYVAFFLQQLPELMRHGNGDAGPGARRSA